MSEVDKAPARYAILSVLRLLAVAMIGGGMLVAFGENEWLAGDIRVPAGLAIIGVGLVLLLWAIPTLRRRWRSPQ